MKKKPEMIIEKEPESCGNCLYGKPATPSSVECHRFPAQITGWVSLRIGDHCGEWAEKEPNPSP